MTTEFLSLRDPDLRSDWLRRELGVRVSVVSGADFLARAGEGRPVGIFLTQAEMYAEALRRMPADSVVALVPTDQHYTTAIRDVLSLPAVRAAFRPHSLDLVGSSRYAAVVAWGYSDARPASSSPRQMAAALRTGLTNRARIRSIRHALGSRYGAIPVGYTNKFARAFEDVFGPFPADASLFDVALDRQRATGGDRPIDISFRGARGQFQRRAGIHLAAQRPRSDCSAPSRQFNGRDEGLDAATYVTQLRQSRFALCPPGFVVNESFRAYESLLCGALPVVLEVAMSQGTRRAAELAEVVAGRSWTAALRRMDRMSEAERLGSVVRALAACRAAHRETARRLRELLDVN
jgi:hypothetical protein